VFIFQPNNATKIIVPDHKQKTKVDYMSYSKILCSCLVKIFEKLMSIITAYITVKLYY